MTDHSSVGTSRGAPWTFALRSATIPQRLGVVLAVVASACGSGAPGETLPELNQGLPTETGQRPVADYERSPSDTQRPVLDPQLVARPSEHSPAIGESCDALCARVEAADCGDGCAETCEAWSEGPVVCADLFATLVNCITRSSSDCSTASEACVAGLEESASECLSLLSDSD